ncbi:MAG: hypothetical protein Q9157_001008 [Trypethelium eluteriae]
MGSLEHTLKENGMVQVTLPEMFLFFLAQPPRVNPHYEKVRQESEAWLLKIAFDNGHLQKNPEEARKLIDGLVSIMRNENFEPEHPLLIAYKSIWLRLSQTSSKGVQNRFAASMTSYVEAVMQQVNLQSTAVLTSTIEGLVALRRDSIATTPIYALIE